MKTNAFDKWRETAMQEMPHLLKRFGGICGISRMGPRLKIEKQIFRR
jgi:hypothetical protein